MYSCIFAESRNKSISKKRVNHRSNENPLVPLSKIRTQCENTNKNNFPSSQPQALFSPSQKGDPDFSLPPSLFLFIQTTHRRSTQSDTQHNDKLWPLQSQTEGENVGRRALNTPKEKQYFRNLQSETIIPSMDLIYTLVPDS